MTTDAANGFIACGRAPRIGPARRSASIRKGTAHPRTVDLQSVLMAVALVVDDLAERSQAEVLGL
jgi:hypothetical protein